MVCRHLCRVLHDISFPPESQDTPLLPQRRRQRPDPPLVSRFQVKWTVLSIGRAVRSVLLCFCICYSGIATQMQTSQQGLSFGMISVSPAFGYLRWHTSICENL